MRRIELTAYLFLTAFAIIACAGIAVGHDWKIALVPFTMLPVLKIISMEPSQGLKLPGFLSTPITSALIEAVIAMLATGYALAVSTKLSNGSCPWSAGAMAAAISAASATSPFAGSGKYRPLRVFSMLGASAFYVAVAIATSGNYDLTSYGAAFALPFFAVARVALAIRDWRKEAHK